MHELSVTGEILAIVLKHVRRHHVRRVARIVIEVGELSDIAERWLQHYFSTLSRGTAAEDAEIEVLVVPCTFDCSSCGAHFESALRQDDEEIRCPECASGNIRLVSGDQFTVKSMEAV